MAAWGAWFGGLGEAVVDGGNPFAASASVDGGDAALTGYSVRKADDLGSATEMAKTCPLLADGGSVEVYEAFDVM